jgi:hypothetical protein
LLGQFICLNLLHERLELIISALKALKGMWLLGPMPNFARLPVNFTEDSKAEVP